MLWQETFYLHGWLQYLTTCCRSRAGSLFNSVKFVQPPNSGKMNKLILCLFFAATSLTLSAQKVYFVYIQSESGQPFYARVGGKVHSSTPSGYLILSKLIDSAYAVTIGFPRDKWPEANFSIVVGRKDHGYLLKNFAEKGWGLYNLQTMAILMPEAAGGKTGSQAAVENKDASDFTSRLSRAADDPSLKEKPPVPAVPEKKTEPVAEVKTEKVIEETKPQETAVVPTEKKAEPQPEEKKETVIIQPVAIPADTVRIAETPAEKPAEMITTSAPPEYQPSVVTRRSESSTTEGFGLVFVDTYPNGDSDTIRLLIPNPKPVVPTVSEAPREEKKMLDIPVEVKKTEEPLAATVLPADTIAAKTPAVSRCTEAAADADFYKLRKQMAAVESDDDMISEAKKYFREKCFATAQVKNLSTLFLSDEGKYKFFDAAYNFVTDAANFPSLQSELKEEYYINRFRAMLR